MSANKLLDPLSIGMNIQDVKDQYADGVAADAWSKFIGDTNLRTQNYKDFLIGVLKKHGCVDVLDIACGTGIDSIMLLEEGFKVVSLDASDKMLKHAYKTRWEKRDDPRYNQWVIEEARWETLTRDIEAIAPGKKFDAVICLGNSFSHVLDEFGDNRVHKMCMRNFAACLKPGGVLIMDHRNYEEILTHRTNDDIVLSETKKSKSNGTNGNAAPEHSIYFNCAVDVKNSVLVVHGKPMLLARDYSMDSGDGKVEKFRFVFYPHRLDKFTSMLDEAFGEGATHDVYGDYKPLSMVAKPDYYIHIMKKPLN